ALFDKTQAEYIDDGHTQLLQPRDPTGSLSSPIYHDDRKSLARWLASQEKYASLEAQKLLTPPSHDICLADRIRKMILVAPFLVFFYCLFVKGGIRDGWRGVYYALQRFTAEAILSLKLIHHKIGP
ncbi:MAG: hypothetical protein KDD55_11665, partial [Bdellovibrionales bacterium]|nr:hypothetical protein [Bdellovibrionales bacterium]